jgi:hypothetical protein
MTKIEVRTISYKYEVSFSLVLISALQTPQNGVKVGRSGRFADRIIML